MLSGPKYLACCLSLTFVLVMAAAAFNWFADPTGIYHFGKSWDWVRHRPALTDYEFIHKAHQVRVQQPDVIFLGSSRSAEGLDPHTPGVPPNAYNLALHHGTIYEAYRYLQNACAVHVPKTVVVGIDLTWFAASLPSTDAFSEDRLAVRADGSPTPWFTLHTADLASTLFSLPTLESSFQAIAGRTKLPYDDGYSEQAPAVLEQMDRASRVLAANKKWMGDISDLSPRDAQGRSPQVDAFRHIVDLCAAKHIHLIVFVHPLHAMLIDRLTDNWDLYAAWMKDVATKLGSTPGLDAELWDFAGYNSMNIEPFPSPTDTYSHMHFYWDAFHYHKVVGDRVLQTIFSASGPIGFGERVTASTVGKDLARLQAEKRAWHEQGQVVPIALPEQIAVPLPK
jgi:hypothetical protein